MKYQKWALALSLSNAGVSLAFLLAHQDFPHAFVFAFAAWTARYVYLSID
jgi:hypothetical protein